MKPREFLNFFKTRTGKLVLFGALFGCGLILFSTLRERSDEKDVRVTRLTTNATDKPQVVQSIERPMLLFRPPPPKSAPPPTVIVQTKEPAKVGVEKPRQESPPQQLAPISLLADANAGLPEPRGLGSIYAPFGRLISCETVTTVDSSSIQTPVIGLVIDDLYHLGKLIIPAGTEVHGTAQTDHHRERIATGGSWTLVWQSGEELHLKAIALDREFAGDQEGWGMTDGSAGLRGRVIKSDNMAEIKLFAATFLSGVAGALTEKEQTLFGPVDSRSLNNAPFQGAQKVLSVYAQRIYEAIQSDGFYVRVPSGKQFYLYVLQTIDRSQASVGGSSSPFADESVTNGFPVTATAPVAPFRSPAAKLFQP